MKARILATVAVTLALAPAASAATTTTWDAGTSLLTLTNDADSETFSVTISYQSAAPTGYEYRITATNAVIPVGTSPCESQDGGKTLFCDSTDAVGRVVIKGGDGTDTFTIAGSTYYSGNSPGLEVDGEGGGDTFKAGPGGALRGDGVSGGPGDDTFIGSDVNADYFYAEEGNDTYKGGTAPVPAGIDPDGFQRRVAEDSWYSAGSQPLSISLDGAANDTDGQGGTDNLADIEAVQGGDGDDTLTAGAGTVDFEGGDGNDTLTGSPQTDALSGDGGNDTLRGAGGDDFLYDGDFDSTYRLATDPAPTPGNDTLEGGDGNDFLSWGAGKDDIVGGAGNDTASTSRFATQVVDSPTLPDDFTAKAAPVTVSLDDQADDGVTGANEGDNVHADVENLTVEGGSEMVSALRSARISSQTPLPAPNTLTGSAAPNVIVSGDGNDTIDPGAGADTVDAGGGDDTISAVDKTTDILTCGRGTDAVAADLEGSNAPRADVLQDCENVSGTALGLEGGVLPTAPVVTLGGGTTIKVKKFLRSYTVTTPVTTDQDAAVRGELSIAGARIAKVGALAIGSGKLKTGKGTRKLKTKVAVRYRKSLKRKLRTKKQRKRGVKLRLLVTVTNASGQTATKSRTIRLKG